MKLFNFEDKTLKKARKKADAVMALESKFAAMTDDELRAKTAEYKERYKTERVLTTFFRRFLRR